MKNANGKKGLVGIIVWSSVSAFAVALIIVVNVLATTVLYGLFNLVFNGPRPMFKSGVQPYYVSEYDSKKEVYNAARDFNETLAGEGFVLLKNKNGALPIKTPESDAAVSENRRSACSVRTASTLLSEAAAAAATTAKAPSICTRAWKKRDSNTIPRLKSFTKARSSRAKSANRRARISTTATP